jgi:hypothetical protein
LLSIAGGQAELRKVSVEPADQSAHELVLVGRDLASQVSERARELAAEVGDRLQPAFEGDRLSCLWIAGERTINVELSVGAQAIDYPVDLSVSKLGGALDQFSPLLFVRHARNLYGVLLR